MFTQFLTRKKTYKCGRLLSGTIKCCRAVFSVTQPLSCLFVHDQRDVALDQGEGEEADVAGVLVGCTGLLWPGKKKKAQRSTLN